METVTIDTTEYDEIARTKLKVLRAEAQAVLVAHPELGPSEKFAVADLDEPPYTWNGKVIFTGFGILQHIPMCCSSTPPINANANVWGITSLAAGVSFGKYMFNVPASKLPTMDNIHIVVTVGMVMVQISFWDGPTAFGMFIGGGLGMGVGVLYGNTKFVNGGC